MKWDCLQGAHANPFQIECQCASVSEGKELSVRTTDRGAISELLPELLKASQLLRFIYTDRKVCCPECSGGFSCFKDSDDFAR